MLARYRDGFIWVTEDKINYIDTSFYQLNSITSSSIPFFQHNDAARMLMATNMQRQAVPILINQEPLISSGVEANVGVNTALVVRSKTKGVVAYADSQKIIIQEDENGKSQHTYLLKQLVASNKNVLDLSFPIVKKGDLIEENQIIANGSYTKNNELSLGYNLRVAYCC
jgi:DNA-directed RNA polymerase beta subunit